MTDRIPGQNEGIEPRKSVWADSDALIADLREIQAEETARGNRPDAFNRQVSVDADDLALVLSLDTFDDDCGDRVCSAAGRLRAVLTPPQPTLREKLAESFWGYTPERRDILADQCLPIVEAAVSEAAEEAWNAAVSEALTIHNDSTWKFASDAIAALLRPTEGSAQ